MPKPRFRLGRIISTAAALQAMEEAEQDPYELLERHLAGDWGEVSEAVQRENEMSARSTFTTRRSRIFSAYTLRTGLRIWILTEADRSVTTLFRPEEYHMVGTDVVGPLFPIEKQGTQNQSADEGD